MSDIVPAHSQTVTNVYTVLYPDHYPRQEDPHYHAFEAWRKAHIAEAVCFVGRRVGFDECADAQGNPIPVQPPVDGKGIELHHHWLEFAVINAAYLKALQIDFPDLTTPERAAIWAETDANFLFLCVKHHRAGAGAHKIDYANFCAEEYVRNLIAARRAPA